MQTNEPKTRLGDVEKLVIDARKSNIFQAEKLYKEQQARKRSRSL
ncbi:hypothetical protein [Lautropia mirabilis]